VARQVFFSFHHKIDVWRAGQVRNSRVTQDRKDSGFWDSAAWEEVNKKDKASIRNWIDLQMKGTSVTVVLIGAQTSEREHISYEISQSHNKGNGMLGIYIHNMKDVNQNTDTEGKNPFDFTLDGKKISLSSTYPTYDWVSDKGRENMGTWIETAARKAGR
jgi:hypothetical protein